MKFLYPDKETVIPPSETINPPDYGEGEIAPDFSKLAPKPKPVSQEAREMVERTQTPKPGDPDYIHPSPEQLQAEQDARDREEKEKQEKAAKAEPVKTDETKPKEEVVEPKGKEPDKKPKEEVKKEADVKLLSDEEIEDLHPEDNISEKGLANFKEMRGLVKTATKEARKYQAKITELEKQLSEKPTVPEDINKELEELRRQRLAQDVDNDPKLLGEFNEKMHPVKERLVAELKRQGLGDGMTPEEAKEFFDKELWEKDDRWWKEVVIRRLTPEEGADTEDLERSRRVIKRCLEDRDDLKYNLTLKIEEAKKDLGKYAENRDEEMKRGFEAFRDAIRDTVIEHSKDHEWASLKDIPADATKEMKESYEKHNANVVELAAIVKDIITKITHGDPRAIGTAAFAHIKVMQMVKQADKDGQEIKSLKKRLEDAEQLIANARKSGRMAQVSREAVKPPARKLRPNEPDLGGTSKDVPPDFSYLGRR